MTRVTELAEIIAVEGSNAWKAERCLKLLGELPQGDYAEDRIGAVAQTYALLAISEAIAVDGGVSVVEAIVDTARL